MPLDHQFIQPYGLPDTGVPLVAQATIQSVLPGYLGVTGVRLEAGRDFTMDDLTSASRVVIVDRRIAAQLWPAGAVGQRVAIGQGATPRVFEIIGISSPVRALAVRDAMTPHVFAPYDQFGLVMSVVVATDRPAASIGPALKRTIEALGTQRPVHDLLPMRTYVDRAMGDTRFTMLIVVSFAAMALVLAGIGLYGTLAYLTAQRRREFGVRMTLGASGGRLLTEVVREGLLLALTGTLVGAAGAVAAGRVLRELLYDVSPLDGATLMAVVTLVGTVALVATIHPAIRAARTDPAVALRAE
jgi:putative ABC transport system permease protein